MIHYLTYINHFFSLILNKLVLLNHLEIFIGIFSDLPIFFLPIFLILFWLYYNIKKINKKDTLLYVFYASTLGIIINIIIQQFFKVQRPETFIKPILKHVPDNSFPSDHAAISFAFLIALYLFGYKKTFWIFLPFVLIMGLSRIAGGLHWFFDILVGAFVGILTAFFIYKIHNHKYIQNLNKIIIKLAGFLKL